MLIENLDALPEWARIDFGSTRERIDGKFDCQRGTVLAFHQAAGQETGQNQHDKRGAVK